MPIAVRPGSIVQRLLPVLAWLPGYRREWLLPDVLAGLAVWAVMVPEGMLDATRKGVNALSFCAARMIWILVKPPQSRSQLHIGGGRA